MRSRTRAISTNKFAALIGVVGGVNASDAARIFTSAAQLERAVSYTLAASVRGRETCATNGESREVRTINLNPSG
jgi:antirestriction protein ArdC